MYDHLMPYWRGRPLTVDAIEVSSPNGGTINVVIKFGKYLKGGQFGYAALMHGLDDHVMATSKGLGEIKAKIKRLNRRLSKPAARPTKMTYPYPPTLAELAGLAQQQVDALIKGAAWRETLISRGVIRPA